MIPYVIENLNHFLKSYGPNFFSIYTIGDGLQGEINSSQNGSGASLSTGTKNGNNGNLLSQLTKSTIVSIFVIVLLSFLFCSSLYLVFRIDSLQKQVRKHQCTLIAIQKIILESTYYKGVILILWSKMTERYNHDSPLNKEK